LGAGALGGGGCLCPMPLAWLTAENGLLQEPDMGPVTKLGDRENPRSSLGTCSKPALIRALPAGHCPGATRGVAVLLQQAPHAPSTARATPVPGEDFKHRRGWW